MTDESVNANASSRKCVTLRLDPCPLELGREPNTSPFGAIFEISTGHRKKTIQQNRFFFSRCTTAYTKIIQLG